MIKKIKINLALKAEILREINKKARKYFKVSVESKEHDEADKMLDQI